MLPSNCHVKCIFPLTLAIEGSALGLIFFSVCCFMMPEIILVFKQRILFWKIKFGGETERICRIFFRGFLGPVNGPKNSTLNWVLNLNVENKFFPLSKTLSFLLLSTVTWENQISSSWGWMFDLPNLPTYFPMLATFFIIHEAFYKIQLAWAKLVGPICTLNWQVFH